MYHVVIGVDDDDVRATSCAQAVINLPGEADEKRVTVFHSSQNKSDAPRASNIHSVRTVCDHLDEHGIEFEIAESSGDPADAILDVAEDVDADLVVVAGRKRSPAGKALFGSVTQAVILHADRPVMVAGDVEQR